MTAPTNQLYPLHHDSSNQPIISISCLPRERLRRGKTFSHDIQANSTFDSKSPYPSASHKAFFAQGKPSLITSRLTAFLIVSRHIHPSLTRRSSLKVRAMSTPLNMMHSSQLKNEVAMTTPWSRNDTKTKWSQNDSRFDNGSIDEPAVDKIIGRHLIEDSCW